MHSFFIRLLVIAVIIWADLHAIQMGIITASNYVGDREVAWRIKRAGERLGWKVFLDEDRGRTLNYHELDWVICMLPDSQLSDLPCPNYLMVFHPFNYLNEKRRFLPFFEKYDGYLLTIHDRGTLEFGLKRAHKKFHYISFYPTVYVVPYKELAINDLMVMIPVWGNRLEDPKFGILYKLLNDAGFAKFYGIQANPNIDLQKYMGPIPFDGSSVIDILQRHGISLVFHSEIHNYEAIPSSRIFEAAAASTVIISDNNAFVKKHFGNTVFYIDTSGSGENTFIQIQQHIDTIFRNPERALMKAKKAHEIFIKKFTMESQLLNLESMHKRVLKEKGRT